MILITGASGNVGSELLKQAAAAKLKIRAPPVRIRIFRRLASAIPIRRTRTGLVP